MSRTEIVLKVFVASPSDVTKERALLEDIVRELNITWSKQLGIRLDLVRWETHALPGMGVDAQAVINEQIEDDYDIFIGIMWKRAGSPTGRAISGTVEEFQRAYNKYIQNPQSIRIMFYFNDTPVSPSEIDPSHLGSILEFKKALGEKGTLYWTYTSRNEFTSLLLRHLSRQVQEWHKSWGIITTDGIVIQENDIDKPTVANEEPEEGLDNGDNFNLSNVSSYSDADLRRVAEIMESGPLSVEGEEEIMKITSKYQPLQSE